MKISDLPVGWQGRIFAPKYKYEYIFKIVRQDHVNEQTTLKYLNVTQKSEQFHTGTIHWLSQEENYIVIENPEDKEYHDLWI